MANDKPPTSYLVIMIPKIFQISEEQASKKALLNAVLVFALLYFATALLIFPRRGARPPLIEVDFTTGAVFVAIALVLPFLLFPSIKRSARRETLTFDSEGIRSNARFSRLSVKWNDNLQVLAIDGFSKTSVGKDRVFTAHDDIAFVVTTKQNTESVKSIIYYPEWSGLDIATLRDYFSSVNIAVTDLKAEDWSLHQRDLDTQTMGGRSAVCAYGAVLGFIFVLWFMYANDGYFTLDFGAYFKWISLLIIPVWLVCFRWVRTKKHAELVINYGIVAMFSATALVAVLAVILVFITPYLGQTKNLTFYSEKTSDGYKTSWEHPDSGLLFFCYRDIDNIARELTVYQFIGITRIAKTDMCPNDA